MSLQCKHIPNILTIFRMGLVPVIVIFLLVPFGPIVYSFTIKNDPWFFSCYFQLSYLLSGILFVIACISDLLDGWLARKFKWESSFGKFWDPVADKVLINSILICFLAQLMPNLSQQYGYLIPIWIPIIMIGRDVIVDAARMQAASKKIIVSANIFGKLKTIVQMFAIMIIFFLVNNIQPWIEYDSNQDTIVFWVIQNLMMLLALFFSLLSGVIYLYQIYGISKSKRV